ncbi:Scr1 family TA system antitoxin-like transcriptional regulator [Kitasatospora sp. LaBMicrA B282]|uniref:Scr1 family TA system antitoxin-like transcriptional regulator n=1 Tax=Kitasatospora sp. LaBMicrA B282 TaxID=3420949 RepID=UPI003D104B3A
MNKNDLDPTSSPLAAFGVQLRRSRESKGLTQHQLGKRINYSGAFVSYVERAERMPKLPFARRSDEVLETGGTLELMWWLMGHASLVEGFPEFAAHEALAKVIRTFEVGVIPGLLQTRDYAAAELNFCKVRGAIFKQYTEERLAFRLARQRSLERDPAPILHVVLDESCLRRVVGGPTVMAEQLRYLEEVAQRPNFIIQVFPFALGATRGLQLPVTLLTMPDRSLLGYTETLQRGYLERDRETLDRWTGQYDLLQVQSLSRADSLEMIRSIRKELLNMTSARLPQQTSWLKSSYSQQGGQCIEIAPTATPTLPLRDSKDPEGPALLFPTTSFTAFVNGIKNGEFISP